MKLRYTNQAKADIESLYKYIARDDPDTAQGVVERVTAMIEYLPENPALGQRGRAPGSLELLVPSVPFVVVYRIGAENIDILAIIHRSRRWPDRI